MEEPTTPIIIRLTDSPGDFDAVNIDLRDVQIHREPGNQDLGWESLETNQGIYNLLDLSNGVETIIVNSEVMPGQISQIRLVLGPDNSLEINGAVFPMENPGATHEGLKIELSEVLLEGVVSTFLIDFDAARSVIQESNDNFHLDPVLRGVFDANNSSINGNVFPAEEGVVIYAVQENDTLGSSYSLENDSEFFIGGLEPGTYSLVIDPGDLSDYRITEITDVQVTQGQIKEVSDINLGLK